MPVPCLLEVSVRKECSPPLAASRIEKLGSRTLFNRLQLYQHALTPFFDLVEFALHDANVFELAFEVGAFVNEDLEQGGPRRLPCRSGEASLPAREADGEGLA